LLEPRPSDTAVAHATAVQMAERHGVVTREAVLSEGLRGGYSAVYPVLRVLEERGQLRRGYFVAGLGAAQFALPGAVDRLRSTGRDDARGADAVVLASTDPAQPYGAVLPWPETTGRPARTASSVVVLRAGLPLAWYDRRSFHLVTFPETRDDHEWASALATLVDARAKRVEIRKVDGEPVDRDIAEILEASGYVAGYRGHAVR